MEERHVIRATFWFPSQRATFALRGLMPSDSPQARAPLLLTIYTTGAVSLVDWAARGGRRARRRFSVPVP